MNPCGDHADHVGPWGLWNHVEIMWRSYGSCERLRGNVEIMKNHVLIVSFVWGPWKSGGDHEAHVGTIGITWDDKEHVRQQGLYEGSWVDIYLLLGLWGLQGNFNDHTRVLNTWRIWCLAKIKLRSRGAYVILSLCLHAILSQQPCLSR